MPHLQDDYEEKWSEKYLQQAASLQSAGEDKDEDDSKDKETPMNPMMAMMMNPMMAMMMNPMMAGMNPMTPGRAKMGGFEVKDSCRQGLAKLEVGRCWTEPMWLIVVVYVDCTCLVRFCAYCIRALQSDGEM